MRSPPAGFVADPHTMPGSRAGRGDGGRDRAHRAAARMGGWNPHSQPTAYPPTRPRRTASRRCLRPPTTPPGPRPAARGYAGPAASPSRPRRRRRPEPSPAPGSPTARPRGRVAETGRRRRRPPPGAAPFRAVAQGHGAVAAGAAGPDRAAARLLPGLPRRRAADHGRPAARLRAGPGGERLPGQPSRPGWATTGVRSAPVTGPSTTGRPCGWAISTPEGRGAQLVQSNVPAEQLIPAELTAGAATGARPTWPGELAAVHRPGQRAGAGAARTERTVIVVGDARDNELRELAAALR